MLLGFFIWRGRHSTTKGNRGKAETPKTIEEVSFPPPPAEGECLQRIGTNLFLQPNYFKKVIVRL
jgi:hypothetical protein